MAYDEELAERVRAELGAAPDFTERRMFGGLAFLAGGNMALAVLAEGRIMVRADRDQADELVAAGEGELVEMRGRPMRGWLEIGPDRLRTRRQLARWVDLGVIYARSLPPR